MLRAVLDRFLKLPDPQLAQYGRWLDQLNLPATRQAITAFLQEQP
ncbi:hypothetical protein BOO71_0014230 [Deinococcus marmoris]|uniref:Uncharacterized protein n=1 Tax=Deinococcus marmoris TaxID=249408 RepID=A0A1U7NRS4_9DEIO|nr:hypothetical protein BOO71_0014230 [Deinococcus marmoris]